MSNHQFTEPADTVTQFTDSGGSRIEANNVEIKDPKTGEVVAGIRNGVAFGEVERIPKEIIDQLAN